MQFKHPEILYALFLLIIPILVHLFQLQRFVKTPFTNVKFLKKIAQESRKSARIKKWLILVTRLLVFTCLILAFAQPYLSRHSEEQNYTTTIYLDNSFSMQAKGAKGELLKTSIQKIIESNTSNNHQISILTNNNSYLNLDAKNLKNELKKLKYYPNKLAFNTLLLKLNSFKIDRIKTLNKNILISDFQNINIDIKTNFTNVNQPVSLLKLTPSSSNNVYIDSVYIQDKNISEITLKAIIKSSEISSQNTAVSLFENAKLIGKTTARFNKNKETSIIFTIPNSTNFNGKISVVDPTLEFDNDFYFSISTPSKINVLSIGKAADFLSRIYTENEFNFTSATLQKLNYNNIQNQQLIVLNEIENLPVTLINSLVDFSNNGGNIVLIPAQQVAIPSYNKLLNTLQIGRINKAIQKTHKITAINYEHPLLKDVFEKKVTNFQYPTSKSHYQTRFINSSQVIKFDNNESFIASIKTKNSNFYWVAAPLNIKNTDFTQTSLIVPVFYNFATNSSKFSELFYTIGAENEVAVKTTIKKDAVLTISNGSTSFIPFQTISQNKVTLKITSEILKSGFYTIYFKNKPLKTLAFNYNREESDLTYANLETISKNNKNISIAATIDEVFEEINNQQEINWLFKWFLAFSVLFLFIEMLILKYFNI